MLLGLLNTDRVSCDMSQSVPNFFVKTCPIVLLRAKKITRNQTCKTAEYFLRVKISQVEKNTKKLQQITTIQSETFCMPKNTQNTPTFKFFQ